MLLDIYMYGSWLEQRNLHREVPVLKATIG